MARQRGIDPKTGTIGDETHYKIKDKYYVRKKSSLTGKTVRTHPSFANSRYASGQFGRASTCSRLLRRSLAHLLNYIPQKDMHNRLIKTIREMIGDVEQSARKPFPLNHLPWSRLKDFDFNNEARLKSLFLGNYSIKTNRSSGRIIIKIPFLEPTIDVKKSYEATHIRVIAVAAAINFSKEVFANDYIATDYILLNLNNITDIRLSLTLPAPVIHPLFVAIGTSLYMKESNDQIYDLLNQRFQPLAIIHVEYDPLPSKTAPVKKHKTKKAGKKKQGARRKG